MMMSIPRIITLTFLFLLVGCTPVGYVKPGVSGEQVQQDLTNCTELARHQAFRDLPIVRFRPELGYGLIRRRDPFLVGRHRPNLAELQHRYRRVCILARGYQLAPLQP